MFRKQTRSWVTAALVLVFVLTSSPGRAASLSWQAPGGFGWEGLWERVVTWFGGSAPKPAVHPEGQAKTCSMIDPDGQPACSKWFGGASAAPRPAVRLNGQTKTCGMIDPNGQPLCSTGNQPALPVHELGVIGRD